jgi:hypothetical protein
MGCDRSKSLGKGLCGWVYGVCYDLESHWIYCKYQCQEGKVAVSFHLHSELDVLMYTVQVIKEYFHLLWSMRPDEEIVIYTMEPAEGVMGCLGK